MLDQRDIDGEFFASGDELFGAVQRIDQPPARPPGTLGKIQRAVFLGQNRNGRIQRAETIGQ